MCMLYVYKCCMCVSVVYTLYVCVACVCVACVYIVLCECFMRVLHVNVCFMCVYVYVTCL